MIVQVGKNEFGVQWAPENLKETLLHPDYKETLVELEVNLDNN